MLLGMSQSEADKTEERGTDEGKKLKSTSGWSSDGNGTDEVGFSALPGGRRQSSGQFASIVSGGEWWTSDELGTTQGGRRYIWGNDDRVGRTSYNKEYGYSVRCIKND